MPSYFAPFRDDTVLVRVQFIREYDVNYHVNEWDFEKSPQPPATDAECDEITAWVDELEDDGPLYED